ncbi:hypothetical protein FHP25_35905 [Vineibacter terrae]|uniref:Bacteriophage Mu GpT domain-containing protein n=1 Tax=Vineibacter terrae TaxID=2586908 RepID=A0A5C8P9A5_9HYPH|nr:prohead protease/major capsid protein fusion protein [Vineibacter terrae]TXL70109.1 hypothetical protein FHP25_35905 [Vineibacter terrae]
MEGQATRDMQMQSRQGSFVPGTYNAQGRTIDVVWTTGARVPRMDWWSGKRYDEELSLERGHVRLDRLNNGAPVLDTHGRFELRDIIGVVQKASIDGKEGRATLRFSEREEVAPLIADIQAGIIRNISVGYIVHRYDITKVDGQRELWRATDWEPTEISFVPIGADAGAGTRAGDNSRFPCMFVTQGEPARNPETRMDPHENAPGGAGAQPATTAQDAPAAADATRAQPTPAPAPAAQPVDVAAEVQRALAAARERDSTIRERVRAVGLPEAVADQLVRSDVTVEHVGNRIVDELARRGTQHGGHRIELVQDHTDPTNMRGRLVDALAARATAHLPANGGRIELPEASRSFARLGLLGAMAELARAHGQRVERDLPSSQLYEHLVSMRALSMSDFPLLLADSANKVMLTGYALRNPTYRLIFARKRFTDFKPHSFLRDGDFPNLLEKGETGEFKYGSISESRQQITLAEYGRIIGINRRIIINDDLGAFADLPMKAGRRVADFENATAWAMVVANPNITEPVDGAQATNAVFSAGWGTLAGAGADIDIDTISAGRQAMMEQQSLDGLRINVSPQYLVTSPAKYTKAEQFCAVNLLPNQPSQINPFAGRLTPVGEANLTGNGWYLFADPGQAETFVYGYLEGSEGPRMATREGFTTDGIELKVALDFTVGAVDYRGAYKNPGAA